MSVLKELEIREADVYKVPKVIINGNWFQRAWYYLSEQFKREMEHPFKAVVWFGFGLVQMFLIFLIIGSLNYSLMYCDDGISNHTQLYDRIQVKQGSFVDESMMNCRYDVKLFVRDNKWLNETLTYFLVEEKPMIQEGYNNRGFEVFNYE